MLTKVFKDKKLSLLGFGTMRLPLNEEGKINEEKVEEMVDYALKNGVNYFDTAYPYHNGESEIVIGKVLSKYPRDSYYLATKYPGHQISSSYDPAVIFEEQLEKCGVDYFDFYLLHNVYENSIKTYLDPKWGIVEYFKEQKRLGRIKHLGFSTHGGLDVMTTFLDVCGEDMEFCQIQLNYLDYTLQNGKEKVALLKERNIPVWVMEPVRGGKLSTLKEERETLLKSLRPNESISAWGFRFLQSIENVNMILSGMSNMEHMLDNIKTFSEIKPLGKEEIQLLFDIAEEMKDSIPCTGCRYCCDDCPMQLDIPKLLSITSELRILPSLTVSMRLEGMDRNKLPSACIACGKCTQICPQKINVCEVMKELDACLKTLPSWEALCKQREDNAKK